MIIDIHTHITYAKFPEFSTGLDRKRFTVETLLQRMDMEGIDKSVVLPLGNPENAERYAVAGNQETLEACRKHPDRLIPFCNIDPRAMHNTPKADLSRILRIYKDLGCLGIGEICANLPIRDPRYLNLFRHAEAEGMPLLFHFASKTRGVYGAVDKIHLPGLEQCLKEFPGAIFIGHGPAFWAEIAWDVKQNRREGYPTGSIRREGAIWRLLEKYPNFYGDLSAGSAYNAMTRDVEVGYRFLKRFHKKLFFGTDRFTAKDEPVPEILTHLKEARKKSKIGKAAYDNIMFKNFNRVILKGGKR